MWDKARDVITVLLVPALGWVLMVSRAIETERIHAEALKRDVSELTERVDRLQERNEATTLQLVRLETRLDGLGVQLERIESMLTKLAEDSHAQRRRTRP